MAYFATIGLSSRHRKTLAAVFEDPARANVRWREIERLFEGLGAEISEGRGSRVRVALGTARAVFHRPHPQPTTDKGALKSVRKFLLASGALDS